MNWNKFFSIICSVLIIDFIDFTSQEFKSRYQDFEFGCNVFVVL